MIPAPETSVPNLADVAAIAMKEEDFFTLIHVADTLAASLRLPSNDYLVPLFTTAASYLARHKSYQRYSARAFVTASNNLQDGSDSEKEVVAAFKKSVHEFVTDRTQRCEIFAAAAKHTNPEEHLLGREAGRSILENVDGVHCLKDKENFAIIAYKCLRNTPEEKKARQAVDEIEHILGVLHRPEAKQPDRFAVQRFMMSARDMGFAS